jgi:hypothetical protein
MKNLNLKKIVEENLDGLVEFVKIMIIHNGNIKPQRLWKVEMEEEKPNIRIGYKDEHFNDYCVLMGGEVSNSFMPLYELGYFFQALFLSAVGSAVLKKGFISKYKSGVIDKIDLDEIIKKDLLSFDNNILIHNLQSPLIAIVSAMDTDVTPIRYNKHHLWRIKPESLNKYGGSLTISDYGNENLIPNILPDYWVDEDVELADYVMSLGLELPKLKAIMNYITLQKVCKKIGIDITNIPLYFLLSPKEELENAGNEFSFLDVLSAVNTPEKKVLYKLLTKQDNPWVISTSCPSCGQASKTIIYTKIGDGTRTIRVSCRKRDFTFSNERGDQITDHGCGLVSYYDIPRGTKKLYEFIKNNQITLHFPTRSVMFVLTDSAVTPICFVAGDLGLERNPKNNKIKRRSDVPIGYGDHLDMLISAVLFQDCILDTDSYDTILGRHLSMRGVYLSHTQTVFCYDKPTELVDDEVFNFDNPKVAVSDTSVFKFINKGNSIPNLFYKSLRLYPFTLESARSLRDIKQDQLLKHSELTY